jgi:TPR repeat protein
VNIDYILSKKAENRKFCEAGDIYRCVELGTLEKNKVEARRLFTKACEVGRPEGCFYLGRLEIEEGNVAEGNRLIEEACKAGLLQACEAKQKAEKN